MQDANHPGIPVQQQHSALLQCLSQLNSDVWSQVLLPKLVEQGSADKVTLTCKQLRDLTFSSVQKLNLGDPYEVHSLSQLGVSMEALPSRFPDCTTVTVELCSEGSYHTIPYILPGLARLRQLDLLSVDIQDVTDDMLAATMLYSMRMQLPQLRGLGLEISDAAGWFAGKDVMTELGRITQLKQLCLHLKGNKGPDPVHHEAVQQLSGLKQLEHLLIWAVDWDEDIRVERYLAAITNTPPLPARITSSLTSLTRLESIFFNVDPLTNVDSCVKLQHLSVCVGATKRQLQPDEWACLAALTCLTHLRLLNVELPEASEPACAALGKLTKLQVFAASVWQPGFLPAVAACTSLTELCGQWEMGSEFALLPLPHVLVLSGAWKTGPVEVLL